LACLRNADGKVLLDQIPDFQKADLRGARLVEASASSSGLFGNRRISFINETEAGDRNADSCQRTEPVCAAWDDKKTGKSCKCDRIVLVKHHFEVTQ
jgi:hypothetical protein